MDNLKVYLAAAKDIVYDDLCDCKIVAKNDKDAEKLARDYFDEHLSVYEFEVCEQEELTEENALSPNGLEEGVYDEAPMNYAYFVFR